MVVAEHCGGRCGESAVAKLRFEEIASSKEGERSENRQVGVCELGFKAMGY